MATLVQFQQPGPVDVLEVVEVPDPQAPDGGVVVEVRAAGVNPFDYKFRQGLRGLPGEAPYRLGSDAAGVVAEVGAGVEGWSVGDAVVVTRGSGTYASHLVATPDQLLAKPDDVSFEQGAALGVPVGTAYQALKSLGVEKGQTLLVHAGSGAVGQAAIQLARHWGVEVVATASEPNHDRLRELGATPVAYGPGLLDRLKDAAPHGYDRVLDNAGTDEALDASFALVADRHQIGTIVAGKQAAELGILAWRGGSPDPLTDEQEQLRRDAIPYALDLIAQGAFEVEIAARYPLVDVRAAHEHSESGHVRGKIVLVP